MHVNKIDESNFVKFSIITGIKYVASHGGYNVIYSIQSIIMALVSFECMIVCVIMTREQNFTVP